MANSYIGIATPSGLRRLMPEDQCPVYRLLGDDLHHLPSVRLCFWVVLPDSAALSALRLLDQGEPLSALCTVNQHAQHLGRISVLSRHSDSTHLVAS